MKTFFLSIKKIIVTIIGRPNYIRKIQWPTIKKFFVNTEEKTCVDVGAGSLYFTEKLNHLNFKKIYAVDIFFDDYIKKYANSKDIMLIEGDAQKELPLNKKTADYILLSSVVHMVKKPEELLKECRRILSDKGLIIISAPNEYKFLPKLHSIASTKILNKIFKLPKNYNDFLEVVSKTFSTGTKKGFMTDHELEQLIYNNGFKIISKEHQPKASGSFLWELSLIFYLRFGENTFYFLYLLTPIALVCDWIYNSDHYSCEHIWSIKKNDSY